MKKNEKEAAEQLLAQTKLNLMDSARLAVEMLEENAGGDSLERHEAMKLCRRVIRLGSEAHLLSQKTVTLREAIESLQKKKEEMRERTRKEIRQVCARFVASFPGFEEETVRQIDTARCEQALNVSFKTLPSRRKAKRIISSLFSHSILNGWCERNPMAAVHLPRHKERPIKALMIEEVVALLKAAERPEHILCAPAVGIMLWAGIRPHEIERLQVRHINFEDKVITVPADHAKTGGARQVTMHPVLMRWLRKTMSYYYPEATIVPASWTPRWAQLRKTAGFAVWPPDVLRHTFASYHLKYFRDPQALQLEMGHASQELLRTRYLAMDGVTAKAAEIFWHYGLPRRGRG